MTTSDQMEKIKKLREMTGLGMMTCKKILLEVDYDMDEVIEFMKTDDFFRRHVMHACVTYRRI